MTLTPSNFQFEPISGYQLSAHEFRRLISEPQTQPGIASKIKDWFGYEVSGLRDTVAVRDAGGAEIDIQALHERIQSDPPKQFETYQYAMDSWR